MLIFIDSSNTPIDFLADDQAAAGMEEVLASHFRGDHFVLASRTTLEFLASDNNLSARSRKTANSILANLPTLGNIGKSLQYRVIVRSDENQFPIKTSSNEWAVPLRFFARNGARKSLLLTENIEDAKAFEHAARQYQVASKFPGQVSAEKHGGGGSTTPDALESQQTENRWILCITDSDRLCPESKMSAMAQNCRNFSLQHKTVTLHIDLEAREIENIIPISIFEEILPPTHTEKWGLHKKHILKVRPDAHKYCDLKDGESLGAILKLPGGSPTSIYWNSIVSDLSAASAIPKTCTQKICPKPKDECECVITQGFGQNILRATNTWLDARSAHESEKRTKNDENREAWQAIGQMVFNWCFAPQRTRS